MNTRELLDAYADKLIERAEKNILLLDDPELDGDDLVLLTQANTYEEVAEEIRELDEEEESES